MAPNRAPLVIDPLMEHAQGMSPNRPFEHLGEEWEAVSLGTGRGVGSGRLPKIDRWSVRFRSRTSPQWGEFHGTLSSADLNKVSADDLKRALEEALTVAAIDRSRFVWRTAEGIARETRIPVDQVRDILLSTSEADIIQSARKNQQGHVLYTTRDHLVRTTGEVRHLYNGVEQTT